MLCGRAICRSLQNIQSGEGLNGKSDDTRFLSEFADGSLLNPFPKLDLSSWKPPDSGVGGGWLCARESLRCREELR